MSGPSVAACGPQWRPTVAGAPPRGLLWEILAHWDRAGPSAHLALQARPCHTHDASRAQSPQCPMPHICGGRSVEPWPALHFELANALINHPRLACRDQRRPFAAPCALAGHPRRAPAACAQNSSSSESATAGSTSRLRTRRSAAARSSSCSRARRTGSAAAADGRRCCGSPHGRQRAISLAHWWTGVGCRRPCALQGPGPSSSMQPAPGQPDSRLRCCAAAAARHPAQVLAPRGRQRARKPVRVKRRPAPRQQAARRAGQRDRLAAGRPPARRPLRPAAPG